MALTQEITLSFVVINKTYYSLEDVEAYCKKAFDIADTLRPQIYHHPASEVHMVYGKLHHIDITSRADPMNGREDNHRIVSIKFPHKETFMGSIMDQIAEATAEVTYIPDFVFEMHNPETRYITTHKLFQCSLLSHVTASHSHLWLPYDQCSGAYVKGTDEVAKNRFPTPKFRIMPTVQTTPENVVKQHKSERKRMRLEGELERAVEMRTKAEGDLIRAIEKVEEIRAEIKHFMVK